MNEPDQDPAAEESEDAPDRGFADEEAAPEAEGSPPDGDEEPEASETIGSDVDDEALGRDEERAAAAEFGELHGNGEGQTASLDMLYDLTLPVSIELGRAEMTVEEVLELGRGSVIQLERLAGEPIDVYVGDRRLAEGEVVVVGEYFGVRLTRILSPAPDLDGVAEEADTEQASPA